MIAYRSCRFGWLHGLAWLIAVGTAVVRVAGAQEPGGLRTLGVSGSFRLGYWSSTRDLDAVHPLIGSLAWLKAERSITEEVAYYVEGWAALRGPSSDWWTRAELREAYLDLRVGKIDVRVGRQIVAWGRADGINPTDNLTPRDFTLLVPDDPERRIGTAGVRASWYEGSLVLSALWFPEFRPNRITVPALPGVVFQELFDRWPGETVGLRVDHTGGGIDWSVSFMRGLDLQPDLRLASMTPGTMNVNLDHNRVWVAGADAAMNLGRVGLRAEAAYAGTEDDAGNDPFTKNHQVFLVIGADRTFGERLNVNAQYLFRYVRHFRVPADAVGPEAAVAFQAAILNSQVARAQHGATSRVKHTWRNETLAAELATVAYFGPRGLVLVPKTSYAITDHWTLVAGAEVYRGDSRSVLGLFRTNSVAYGELRLAF